MSSHDWRLLHNPRLRAEDARTVAIDGLHTHALVVGIVDQGKAAICGPVIVTHLLIGKHSHEVLLPAVRVNPRSDLRDHPVNKWKRSFSRCQIHAVCGRHDFHQKDSRVSHCHVRRGNSTYSTSPILMVDVMLRVRCTLLSNSALRVKTQTTADTHCSR